MACTSSHGWQIEEGKSRVSSAQEVVIFFSLPERLNLLLQKILPLSIVENEQKRKATSPFHKAILGNKLNKTPEVTSESDESGGLLLLLLGAVLFSFAHRKGGCASSQKVRLLHPVNKSGTEAGGESGLSMWLQSSST